MQGTPWYQIISNYRYADAFQYIGANVDEREKLIEDGYPGLTDENPEEIRVICEQSDMVMILLNLAYIPDKVINKINFDDFGW